MFVDYKLIHVLCNPFIKPKDIAKLTMHGLKISANKILRNLHFQNPFEKYW